MSAKKSIEEKRAANRERVRRYRTKAATAYTAKKANRLYQRVWRQKQRQLEVNGHDKEEAPEPLLMPLLSEPVSNDFKEEGLYYEDMALVEGDEAVVKAHANNVACRRGMEIPASMMEHERERGSRESRGSAVQRGVAQEAGSGLRKAEVTEEERKMERRLKELTERQARGGLNAGVEVELDMNG